MKKFVYTILICILILALTACQTKSDAENIQNTYGTITPDEVKAMLDEGADFVLIDVRRADEYSDAHIPTAINIANEDINTVRPEALPDTDSLIVIYCRSGRRSKEAAAKLIDMGYTDVRDLGGILDWNYETISGDEPGVWGQSAEHSGILSHFHAEDLNGNSIDQSILADYDLTMVNIWATYCGPCLDEMPDLGELAAEYREKGVQIVGFVSDTLDYDGTPSQSQIELAQDVVSATHADYLHIVPSEDLFGILAQITSVPTTFFVDKNGNQVGYAYIGSMSKSDWQSIIDETLSEVAQ